MNAMITQSRTEDQKALNGTSFSIKLRKAHDSLFRKVQPLSLPPFRSQIIAIKLRNVSKVFLTTTTTPQSPHAVHPSQITFFHLSMAKILQKRRQFCLLLRSDLTFTSVCFSPPACHQNCCHLHQQRHICPVQRIHFHLHLTKVSVTFQLGTLLHETSHPLVW